MAMRRSRLKLTPNLEKKQRGPSTVPRVARSPVKAPLPADGSPHAAPLVAPAPPLATALDEPTTPAVPLETNGDSISDTFAAVVAKQESKPEAECRSPGVIKTTVEPVQPATPTEAVASPPSQTPLSLTEITGPIVPLHLLKAARRITEVRPAVPLAGEEQTAAGAETDDKAAGSKKSVRSRFSKVRPNLSDSSNVRKRYNSFSASMSDTDISHLKDAGSELGSPLPVKSPVDEDRVAQSSSAVVRSVPEEEESSSFENPLGIDLGTARKRTVKADRDEEPRRKPRKMEWVDGPIDRSRVTMRDLIHMNPLRNPMKSTLAERELRKKQRERERFKKEGDEEVDGGAGGGASVAGDDNDDAASMVSSLLDLGDADMPVKDPPGDEAAPSAESRENEAVKKEEPPDDMMAVPQVKIGANGEIILNESSLVIANNDPDENSKAAAMELVHEADLPTTRLCYGRKTSSKLWTEMETKKFYLALSTVGTDFSLMGKLFPRRTRTELKRKFKREEKVNRFLVDKAIREPQQFDQDFFDKLAALEVDAPQPKARQTRKKRADDDDQNKRSRRPGGGGGGGASSGEDQENVAQQNLVSGKTPATASEKPRSRKKPAPKRKKKAGLLYDSSEEEEQQQEQESADPDSINVEERRPSDRPRRVRKMRKLDIEDDSPIRKTSGARRGKKENENNMTEGNPAAEEEGEREGEWGEAASEASSQQLTFVTQETTQEKCPPELTNTPALAATMAAAAAQNSQGECVIVTSADPDCQSGTQLLHVYLVASPDHNGSMAEVFSALPTTEQLVIEQPTIEQPATEQLLTEQPVTEQLVIEQPMSITEQSVTEQPVTEQLVIEQPMSITEQSVTELLVTPPEPAAHAEGAPALETAVLMVPEQELQTLNSEPLVAGSVVSNEDSAEVSQVSQNQPLTADTARRDSVSLPLSRQSQTVNSTTVSSNASTTSCVPSLTEHRQADRKTDVEDSAQVRDQNTTTTASNTPAEDQQQTSGKPQEVSTTGTYCQAATAAAAASTPFTSVTPVESDAPAKKASEQAPSQSEKKVEKPAVQGRRRRIMAMPTIPNRRRPAGPAPAAPAAPAVASGQNQTGDGNTRGKQPQPQTVGTKQTDTDSSPPMDEMMAGGILLEMSKSSSGT